MAPPTERTAPVRADRARDEPPRAGRLDDPRRRPAERREANGHAPTERTTPARAMRSERARNQGRSGEPALDRARDEAMERRRAARAARAAEAEELSRPRSGARPGEEDRPARPERRGRVVKGVVVDAEDDAESAPPRSPRPRTIPPRPAPARRPSQRTPAPSRVRLVGRTALALVSTAVLLATGYGYKNLNALTDNIATTDVISADAGGEKPQDGSIDILMVGMDSRKDNKGNPLPQEILDELQAGGSEDGGLNTDTLILLHIPNDSGKAVAVSFPRDSYVEIAGLGEKHKINSAYGYGKNAALEKLGAEGVTGNDLELRARQAGSKSLIGTIENLAGVKIDHYAEVNLVGFYEITKAVGGVEVCLNNAVREEMSGANFKKGNQTIQGKDALSFVRQRYGLLRGDLDRVVRQQVFMAGLANKVLSAGTLTDPTKLSDMITALSKSITLDEGWDVLQFATQMKGLTGGGMEFKTVPTGNPELKTDDGDAVEVIPSQVKKFFKDLAKTEEEKNKAAVDPATVTVEVRNASGIPGLASRVLQELVALKFVAGDADNADADQVDTAVLYGKGGEAGAQAVADALGDVAIEEDATIAAGTARVVVGSSYDGPGVANLLGQRLLALDGGFRTQQGPQEDQTGAEINAGGIRCVN
ncbi:MULTISPECIES: LCP family protein [Actinosynnema]|uniref:LCP family protein n=1 Tax=Actinosynnema TaxID=40566 RepID=UPI0020A2BA88|nr:LCP family protein [Actinosynnema pretiosum]